MVVNNSMVPDEIVMAKIYFIRDQKVMLDFDLADLYGVETKVLKQSVRRNLNRFPEDFMFELTQEELDILRSQIVTLKLTRTRYRPMAFTEHGVLMLSSTLKSDKAIDVNIQIVRIFTKMRNLLLSQKELFQKMAEIESKVEGQSDEIQVLFEYLQKLMQKQEQSNYQKARTRIGYK